jgi:hypothetical protein
MDNTTTTPSLEAHQIELAERILQFGFFVDIAFGDSVSNNPGHRVLGIESDQPLICAVSPAELDVSRYRIGRILPFLYNYAYQGRRTEGAIDWVEWNSEADDRYVFGAFVEMTDINNIVCLSAEFDYDQTGYLTRMLKLADARHCIDFGDDLSIEDVALLADMSERSVRNALRGEGESRLASADGEHVSAEEALRWLRSRRGVFMETSVTSLDGESLPSALSYAEIPPFISLRLAKLYPPQDSDTDDHCLPTEKAAKVLGWPVNRLLSTTQDAANVRPQDCSALAKVMCVDSAWFTEQVMCALFPKQMALIAYRKEFDEPDTDVVPAFIDVSLTANGIKHGYLDIPATFSFFFPMDSFGGRGKDERGAEVELRYRGQSRMTDIRVKSSITISPRVRFFSYFSMLGAKPGDTLRISQIDDRTFDLIHLPKEGA